MLFTAYTVFAVQTALLVLNSSMYAYILLKKVRTLLERTHGFLSKMLDGLDWMELIPLSLL